MTTRTATSQFRASEDGTIAILWGVSLMVFFGFAALIFDVGRMNSTHGELQAFADSVALTAAGELDGANDAITRATAAAQNLISDSQTFATGGSLLSGPAHYTLTFHSALPANDTTPLGASATTDPAEARFAQVVVTPRTLAMNFATVLDQLLGGGPNPIVASIGAEAVAGFTIDACDITPLMFCLPPGTFTAAPAPGQPSAVGQMIRLRSGGNGAAWGPGDFGFLDPAKADLGATCNGLSGVNLLICLVGAELNVTQCFSQRGVDTEPGQKVGIEDAIFNARFDIFKSTMNNKKNDPNYPPAPNVIKGIVPNGGGSCIGQNEALSTNSVSLPRDNCFYSGTCSHNDRIGDGNWAANKDNYLLTNHGLDDGGNGGVPNDGIPDTMPNMAPYYASVPAQYTNTRYGLYLAELAMLNARLADADPTNDSILLNRDESGLQQCSSQVSQQGARRRVLIAAGIDCVANPINGYETDVPVQEFFEVFLTEPVGDDGVSPPTLDIWVEVIGSAGGTGLSAAGTGGIFRDVVQLYR